MNWYTTLVLSLLTHVPALPSSIPLRTFIKPLGFVRQSERMRLHTRRNQTGGRTDGGRTQPGLYGDIIYNK